MKKIVKYKLITVLPGVFVAVAQRVCKWQCVLLMLIPIRGQEIQNSEFGAGPGQGVQLHVCILN